MNVKTTPLPENLKIKDVIEGETEIPKILVKFLHYLIGGPDSRRGNTDMNTKRIGSIASDIVYSTTAGRKKPGKQLKLGLTVKSLTGSKRVIEVLNRLGHCASYTTLEELETELTYSMEDNDLTPDGIEKDPNLATGVAFDNFDRFVETLSGKDTLHDTVGIVYQCDTTTTNASIQEVPCKTVEKGSVNKVTNRRRRSYEPVGLDIEPYRKKTKISPLLHANKHHKQ